MNDSSLLTIVIAVGLIGVLLSLVRSYLRLRPLPAPSTRINPQIPSQITEEFGPKVTSRRLAYVGRSFTLLFLMALGFHLYWAVFASGPLRFDTSYTDLRNREDNRRRRESESTLRGWIFDRHHDASRTLARYRYLNGKVFREYQLGEAAVHLTGYSNLLFEDVLLEQAINVPFERDGEATFLTRLAKLAREPELPVVGKDLVTTVDLELQREAYAQIRHQRGAVVVINPQNGELLAMASSPGFDPDPTRLASQWEALNRDLTDRPLHNRAIFGRYSPGSTFKTLVATAAIESQLDRKVFTCRAEGWIPPGASRPIHDDKGEFHGQVDLSEAFTHSCNQYFAQMGVELDHQRMGEAAHRFGFDLFTDPGPSRKATLRDQFWNVENPAISSVFAPVRSSFVSGPGVVRYDLALEAIGQGFVQATPLQMALVAAAVANSQGQVMQPSIELARPPVALGQAMSAATAARVRRLMAQVVERGTARSTLPAILGDLVTAGGKTGTAQREVLLRDPRTGEPLKYTDKQGKVHLRKEKQIDSWFIGFAPVENPQVAFAVFVENGGYGAATSAPIAGRLILRARQSGLIR